VRSHTSLFNYITLSVLAESGKYSNDPLMPRAIIEGPYFIASGPHMYDPTLLTRVTQEIDATVEVDHISITPTSVPAPSAVLLLVSGLFGAVAARRGKAKV
jgi:hypothetical protein